MTETPAGWFPDSSQPGRLRWWDGTAWTDHYHDETQAPPPQTQPSQAWPQAPANLNRRRPGPSLALSLVMIVVGLVVAVACGVSVIVPFVRNISSSNTMSVPGQASFHLKPGDYLIYEGTGSEDSGRSVTIDARAVRITGPDGAAVPASEDTGATETITKGSQEYTGAVEFEVEKTGDYKFEILDGRPGRALVARSLTDTLKRALPWILIGSLGGLLLLAGIIMAIIGAIRRHKWNADRNRTSATA